MFILLMKNNRLCLNCEQDRIRIQHFNWIWSTDRICNLNHLLPILSNFGLLRNPSIKDIAFKKLPHKNSKLQKMFLRCLVWKKVQKVQIHFPGRSKSMWCLLADRILVILLCHCQRCIIHQIFYCLDSPCILMYRMLTKMMNDDIDDKNED